MTERDDPPAPVPAVSDVSAAVAELEDRVDRLESSVADHDARQQAVEAYVDRVDHVNETIERRADAALAAVDRLETSLGDDSRSTPTPRPIPTSDVTSGAGVAESDRSTALPRSAHVTDASSTTDDSDERGESASDGLVARILGL